MRPLLSLSALLLSTFALAAAIPACGGNVSISGSNGGSAGAGGGTTTTTTPAGDFYACDGPGQCMLATPGCCDACGSPELGAFVAINSAKLDAYNKYVCPEPTPCPGCIFELNPNYIAYCQAGKCVAADVRTDPVSQCASDVDCRLRNGTSCCEGCGMVPASVVAVSYKAPQSMEALECSPDDVGCPKCAAQYPDGWTAACGASGHCSVSEAPPKP
jgi:hypothetical protein